MTDLTKTITEALERAYEPMDKSTGMYPADWTCRACGVVLNADDSHPAELYAGTYTGLCYRCERKPYYVMPDSELPDGGRRVSHPPHCPSWRRTREEYWSYPDCPDCGGAGMRMVSRHDARGGPYPAYCSPCMARVMAPRRANELAMLDDVVAALEDAELVPMLHRGEESAALSALKLVLNPIVRVALDRWADVPTVWRPTVYVLQTAEARLTPAQRRAKRAATLRRHLLAALRAEAEQRRAES